MLLLKNSNGNQKHAPDRNNNTHILRTFFYNTHDQFLFCFFFFGKDSQLDYIFLRLDLYEFQNVNKCTVCINHIIGIILFCLVEQRF